jgi:hypothetical protein
VKQVEMDTEAEFLDFCAAMMDVAEERFNASCEGEEAESFQERIFKEYVAARKPKDVKEWLEERLASEFLSVTVPPVWVEDEPSWPFANGRPMVFIAQLSMEKNPVTEQHLAWGEEVYLFGARVPSPHVPDAKEIRYRVVVQYRD